MRRSVRQAVGMALGTLFVTLPLPASAQQAAGLSACLSVDNDAARLECYDGMAAMAVHEATQNEPGGWVLEEWPSRLNPAWTDFEVWTASLNAIPGAAGILVHPVLAVSCEQGETRIFFRFGRAIAGETLTVFYRLDAGTIQPGELVPSPDGRQIGLWSSAPSVRFVQALYRNERLRLQVPVEGGEPLTAAFELAGLAAAAAPLKEACAWE